MHALELDHISKQYGNYTAVDDLSLGIKEGEIFGLLGANGAGKTTTMRMVLGLIAPDEGSIRWRGQPLSKERGRMMGYLPEERGLYPKVKVSEQIVYLAELRGMKRKEAVEQLKRWLDSFGVPDYFDKRVEELSKGNQQKIQFIAAVIHNPDIVILDEPFSGLDPVNVELLKSIVLDQKRSGKTILFSSHRMDHVEELCQNICILHQSNTVLKGNIKEIKQGFPRERVMLQTKQPVTGLERIKGIQEIKELGNGYELLIEEESIAQDILQLATSQTVVDRFQVMEPTLNEIFIKKVGGQLA